MDADNPSPQPQDEESYGSEPQHYDRREARREARRERREARRTGSYTGGGWIGGAILIIIGLVFLLRNTTAFELDNWWALFILIPAFGSFATAWNSYQNSGRITAAVRGPLIGGLILLFVSMAFLFGLDFGLLWPVFLILGGLALLFNALTPS
ncbi:MAG TPA: hypothetical protein VFZ76_18890 [Anaerolineales bacterium]